MVEFNREDDVMSLPDDATHLYTQDFLEFINEATSVYHTTAYFVRKYEEAGFTEVKESADWPLTLKAGGKYYVIRSPAIIAFQIPKSYNPPAPFIITAGHIDVLCLKVKPYSRLPEKHGFDRVSVAPYAGGGASQRWDGSFSTWWDRDLGCAGKVLLKGKNGVEEKLVQLPGSIASIPSLAVHFGDPARGPFNYETNMVPVVGLEKAGDEKKAESIMSKYHSSRLLHSVASALGSEVSPSDILDLSLELYASEPARIVGLDGEFIAAPRMDDRVCSFSAAHALINASKDDDYSAVRIVALFENEEVGSGLRSGAKSNFLKSVTQRITESFSDGTNSLNVWGQSIAKSFMLSSDVSHAYNPNFDGIYLEGASPLLNKGPAIYMDANAHMTSNAWSATFIRLISEKVGSEGGEVQLLYPRSDSRTGGTVGPMLSESLGIRALDMGIPMLSMHSIRAMTGAKDPGYAVALWEGMYRHGVEVMEDMPGWV